MNNSRTPQIKSFIKNTLKISGISEKKNSKKKLKNQCILCIEKKHTKLKTPKKQLETCTGAELEILRKGEGIFSLEFLRDFQKKFHTNFRAERVSGPSWTLRGYTPEPSVLKIKF